MIFKGGTLRVVSPKTEDGNRPKIDPVTKQQVYREDFLPLTARKALEDQNKKLPSHLKKQIEVLTEDVPVNNTAETVTTKPTPEPQVIKRRGPKPKNHAQSN